MSIHQIKAKTLGSPSKDMSINEKNMIQEKLTKSLTKEIIALVERGVLEIREYNDSICEQTMYYIGLDIIQPMG